MWEVVGVHIQKSRMGGEWGRMLLPWCVVFWRWGQTSGGGVKPVVVSSVWDDVVIVLGWLGHVCQGCGPVVRCRGWVLGRGLWELLGEDLSVMGVVNGVCKCGRGMGALGLCIQVAVAVCRLQSR